MIERIKNMKLILAIVNNDDSARASAALTDEGYFVTRLSTSGGFLMVGNTTFLIGCEDEKAQRAVDILKEHCKTRKQLCTSTAAFGVGLKHMGVPEEISVGGATVFVLDVENMEKL